jgi:hypothetical protein
VPLNSTRTGFWYFLAAAGKDLGPGVLGAAQNGRDKVGHLVVAGRRFGLHPLLGRRRHARLLRHLRHDTRVDAQEHGDQRDDHDADATAGEALPAGDAHAAAVLDVLAPLLVLEPHRALLFSRRLRSIAKGSP